MNPTKRLIAQGIQKNRRKLWDWHLELAAKMSPAFYCSVDLRDSGNKIVPVDSNLFPAGFNNICPEDQRTAPPIARANIEALMARMQRPEAKKILIIPEAHTSNLYYWENAHALQSILANAGYEVRFGWFGNAPVPTTGPDGEFKLKTVTEKEVTIHSFEVRDGDAMSGSFRPDVVLLNNDFSSGYPKILDQVCQPVVPSHRLGWHSRKKSDHFLHYNRLAREFAGIIGVDPWCLTIDTEESGPVNFNEEKGIDQVADQVEKMLARLKTEYAARKITRKPFVFVKNNSGTYGMGIMVVHDANELREMNRRTKNKMSVGKNRLPIESVAIQEGVPTATLVDRLPAEPVIYLFGYETIGGFLRTNSERGDEDNLNSQGMVFRKLCMTDLRRPLAENPWAVQEATGSIEVAALDAEADEPEPVLELVYGSVARLSALATALELQASGKPIAECH